MAQQYTLEAYNAGRWASYDVDWPDVVAGADWALAQLEADGREAAEWVDRYVRALTQVGGRRDRRLGLRWFQAGIQATRMLGDRAGEAATLNNMAIIYFQRGEPERAEELLHRALQLARDVGAVAVEAAHLHNLASVLHSALGRTDEAIDLATRSISILKQYNLPQDAYGSSLAQHEALLGQMQALRGEL